MDINLVAGKVWFERRQELAFPATIFLQPTGHVAASETFCGG